MFFLTIFFAVLALQFQELKVGPSLNLRKTPPVYGEVSFGSPVLAQTTNVLALWTVKT